MRFVRCVVFVFAAVVPVMLPGTSPAVGKSRYNPKAHKPEWRWVDTEDEAEAAKHFEKLLKRYKTPRQAERLVKLYRKGRPYFGGLPSRETVTRKCADGLDRQLTYILPSRYSPKKPRGVLIFLHGAISQPAPGGGHHEAQNIGKAVDSLGFIKIGPSTYGKHDWGEAAVRDHVHRALEFVKQRFNVDEDRVYLSGDSDGGRGAFVVAETEATFLAASIPTIGAPGGATRFANLRNLPWLAINGAKDGLFKIDQVTKRMDAMKASGFNLEFIVDPELGHDPYMLLKKKKRVCEFIESNPRVPLPRTVDWQIDPGRDASERAFPGNTFRWIRIDETGKTSSSASFEEEGSIVRRDLPRIRAVLAEGQNLVQVETSKVMRFTVLVSDEMFDLEREIVIHVNGKEAFAGKVGYDAKAILEEARNFNDRKLVFVNRVTVEVE